MMNPVQTAQINDAVLRLTREHSQENVYGVLAALDLLGVVSLERLPLKASASGRAMSVLRQMAQSEQGRSSGPIQIQEQEQINTSVVSSSSMCIDPLLCDTGDTGEVPLPGWLEDLTGFGVERGLLEELWGNLGGDGHLWRARLRKNHRTFCFLVEEGRIENPGGFLRRAVVSGWILSRNYQPGYVRPAPQKPQEGPAREQVDPDTHQRVSGMLTGFLERLKPGQPARVAPAQPASGTPSGAPAGEPTPSTGSSNAQTG